MLPGSEGRAAEILKERDRKLEAAREARKQRRVQARQSAQPTQQSLASTGDLKEAHMSISLSINLLAAILSEDKAMSRGGRF